VIASSDRVGSSRGWLKGRLRMVISAGWRPARALPAVRYGYLAADARPSGRAVTAGMAGHLLAEGSAARSGLRLARWVSAGKCLAEPAGVAGLIGVPGVGQNRCPQA